MLSYIFTGIICISVIYSGATGGLDALAAEIVPAAQNAVTLLLLLVAVIPFWSGIMSIASEAGITGFIARLLRPAVRRLFPKSYESSSCREAISMNIAANILGLGNAATPFGLKAVREMADMSPKSHTASDEMLVFIVINTASLQLIPTTIAALRSAAGSQEPFAIILPVILVSAFALVAGVAATMLCCRVTRARRPLLGRRGC